MNQNIQTDLSDDALIIAIRTNLHEFYRYLGKTSPETCFDNGSFLRWDSPVEHSWFNGVLASKLPAKTDPAFIEDALRHFRSRNIRTCTWWLEPHLDLKDWQPILLNHGFQFANDTPGMAVDLQVLNESIQSVDGLDVHVVTDDETLRTWVHVFASGSGLSLEWEPSIFEQWSRLGLDFPLRSYLGYLHGQPVATSCLFIGGGVAGIYSVSTLPEVRGKGIGAAVTLCPLRDAREMGYRIGTLQSSEMGYNVYKKLGFQHVCQIEYFHRSLV